nr:hypothetical protein [Candidatus Sigynarchaeota archaeon]
MNIVYVNIVGVKAALGRPIPDSRHDPWALQDAVPGHDATCIDLAAGDRGSDRLVRALEQAHVVVISGNIGLVRDALDVACLAKGKDCITIMAGYHRMSDLELIARDPGVDVVLHGDEDAAFMEVIDYLDGNPAFTLLKDVAGISFKDETGRLVHTKPRQLERELSPVILY